MDKQYRKLGTLLNASNRKPMAFGTVEITLNETREKCRFFTADERNSTEIMEPKYLKPLVKNRETTGRYSSVCD